MSLSGNFYALVILDDYSRFTWILFLAAKNDKFHAFKRLAKVLENEKSFKIVSIRSDHGGKFQNEKFEHFWEKHGIKHNFLAPRAPQKNGVVERKNRSFEELAMTMLNDTSLPKYFWTDAVNTTSYVLNDVFFKGKRIVLTHLKVSGCKCFILNNGKEQLGKFEGKTDEGIFLGYATHSHAYKV